jgi:hypothetical protein
MELWRDLNLHLAQASKVNVERHYSIAADEREPSVTTQFVVLAWYGAFFIATLAVGALVLPYPFLDDQALFLHVAKMMADGGTLYVDYWDNKQPGIFIFYYVAGRLFGYSELGVHLFQLLWMGAFALSIMVCLRSYLERPWLSAPAGFLAVASYYAFVTPWELAQLEALAPWPIFLAVWFSLRPVKTKREAASFAFVSGLFAGIVVTLKLVLAPMFIGFWALSSWKRLSEGDQLTGLVTRLWFPAGVGVATILSLIAIGFWMNGALGELLWASFVYPFGALEERQWANLGRLIGGSRWLLAAYAGWAVCVGLAMLRAHSGRWSWLIRACLVWLLLGFGVILIQKFSWWTWHFALLIAPVAILAVIGLDILLDLVTRRAPSLRRAEFAILVAALIFAPMGSLAAPVMRKLDLIKTAYFDEGADGDFAAIFSDHSSQHQDASPYPDFIAIREETAFLQEPGALSGPIYVLGNPLYYHLTGRRHAMPLHATYLLESQWERLRSELAKTMPAYLFVEADKAHKIKAEFIEENYEVLSSSERGTWYRVRDVGAQ